MMDKFCVLRKWDDLPDFMRTPEVRPYYNILNKKRRSLLAKQIFDIFIAGILVVFLFIPVILVATAIKLDSPGPVFFRQERITAYGRRFWIYKFRTMVSNTEKIGTSVTLEKDPRITYLGRLLRKYRIDEVPQLLNIIRGEMSLVGTRPEIPFFVRQYTPEMMATLLLPAGVTSKASIQYKDESVLLGKAGCPEEIYIKEILPEKMKINLEAIRNFSFRGELAIMGKTFLAVIGKAETK